MSTEMVTFEFQGQPVRVTMKNGKAQFVAKDVAEILDYTWAGSATIKHVPDCWKGVNSVLTPSGEQSMHVLSEEGLNFFVLRSDKPKALPFQMWLAGEVIPSIRQHGVYVSPAVAASPELMNLDQVIAIAQSVAATAMQTKQAREEARLALEYAEQNDRELRTLRAEVNEIAAHRQEAEQSMLALPAPEQPAPELGLRALINRVVRGYAIKNALDPGDVWGRLYIEFRDRCHIDLKKREKGKSRPLDVAEKLKVMPQLYAVAFDLFAGAEDQPHDEAM